jgi:hypothetical protein
MIPGRVPFALAGWVAGWVAVVAAASAIAWLAIDNAGQQVAGARDVQVGPLDVSPGGARPAAGSATGRSQVPRPRRSSSVGATIPVAVDRTFQMTAGQVAARCLGGSISLRSAQPADGWSVEVHGHGPQTLEASFRSDSPGRETDVRARCLSGVPVFATEPRGD